MQHFYLSMHPANILRALHRARDARNIAVSYRDFTVGATTIALSKSPSQFQILAGINAKDAENTPLNMHAEQLALRKAQSYGADMISVIAVVGETQPDQQSGHEMHTLHPCGKCRTKLADSPLIDNDATLIFTALPSLRKIEISTVHSLKAYHESKDPDKSGVTLLEFPEMEILTPYVPSKNGVVLLQDSESLVQEDRLWAEVVGGYIIKHQSDKRPELHS